LLDPIPEAHAHYIIMVGPIIQAKSIKIQPALLLDGVLVDKAA
jgi:hypothetical protein